jgi:multidrug/hemolysin transport system permease protein
MSLVTLVLAEIYIVVEGGALMSLLSLVRVLGLILLADFTNTAMVFFITSFFSSQNAFATASTVIGTIIGFLTGIYLPVGMLPEAVQWVIKLFPASHAGALLRQVMMADPMAAAFTGVQVEYTSQFKEMLGVTFKFGNSEVSVLTSILILLLSGLGFFGLAVLNISKKKK